MGILPISDLPSLLAKLRASAQDSDETHHKLLYQTPLPDSAFESLVADAIDERLTYGVQTLNLVFQCVSEWRAEKPSTRQQEMLDELEALAVAFEPQLEAALLAAQRLIERRHTAADKAFIERPISHLAVLEGLVERCLDDMTAIVLNLQEAKDHIQQLEQDTWDHATDIMDRQNEDAKDFLKTIAFWRENTSNKHYKQRLTALEAKLKRWQKTTTQGLRLLHGE